MATRMAQFCHCRKLVLLESTINNSIVQVLRTFSASVSVTEQPSKAKIIIPKKIKRDELSVLKALASTVEKDSDAPHYKYIDDPYLIPYTGLEKKVYSLSKIAGKRAAQYVLQRFSNFVRHRPIEDFTYTPEAYGIFVPPKFDDDTLPGLEERILMKKPMLAYQSYQKVQEKGEEEVPPRVQNDLLELLCFYNSADPEKIPEVEELYLEREVQSFEKDKEAHAKPKWNNKGVAEILFKELKSPDYRSYSALLRGRAKYNAGMSVHTLYEEMKEKKYKLSSQDYSAILSVAHTVPEISHPLQFIKDTLQEMRENEVDPTLDVFNSVLRCVSYTMDTRARNDSLQFSMDVINEMRHFGIEPSLGSWFHILNIFYEKKDRKTSDTTSRILYDIMDYLGGKEFTIQHPDDGHFFHQAMKHCKNSLNDLQLAYKVDALLNTGHNYFLMGDSQDTKSYYFYFLQLLTTFEDVEKVMEHYDKFVPHDYSVSFNVMQEILKCVDLNDAFHHLPRLWSDFVLFGFTRQRMLTEMLLSPMQKQKHTPELQSQFVAVTDHLLQFYEDDCARTEMRHPFKFTGPVLGYCIQICCNGGEYEKARNFFHLYVKLRRDTEGFPSATNLESLGHMSIDHKDVETAMDICSLMADLAHGIHALVDRMETEFKLDDDQKNHLYDIQ